MAGFAIYENRSQLLDHTIEIEDATFVATKYRRGTLTELVSRYGLVLKLFPTSGMKQDNGRGLKPQTPLLRFCDEAGPNHEGKAEKQYRLSAVLGEELLAALPRSTPREEE